MAALSRQPKLEPTHKFAGFTWPRYLAILPPKDINKRRSNYSFTGGYYSTGEPVTRNTEAAFFYQDSDFQPVNVNRLKYCDKVADRIEHTGWFLDEFQDEKIRGIVAYLPHGKMLAGWSMGEQMAAELDRTTVYTDETDAAHAADNLAEQAADREQEYREQYEDEDED